MGRKTHSRQARVGAVIQRVVSEQLLEGPFEAIVRQAVVTGVDVSPDLKHARVYYHELYEGVNADALGEALARARGRVALALGRNLHTRSVPRIAFVHDDSVERAQRIEDILRNLHADDEDPTP